ncbi:hypothetical protein KACHI17_05030 [Sediminibacterium sp. KACHI17]|uniref:Uncharacterized protein n=1 Tax=Sediminibacterium sp. KACHI17 TaxID=1751071 RepID=A0AAT9GG54_9BACT
MTESIPASIEMALRGETMRLSTYIESALFQIIISGNVANGRENAINFLRLTFGEKLKQAKELIIQQAPNIYNEKKLLFQYLNDICKFRNVMAHCPFIWKDGDTSFFGFWDVVVPENKSDFQYIDSFKYQLQDAVANIKSMGTLAVQTIELAALFQSHVGVDIKFFDQLQTEINKRQQNG